MALKLKFDSMHNVITPTFVLCTKTGDKFGQILPQNIVVADNMNSYDEISFTVYKYDNGVKCAQWDEIKDFRLVWAKEWDTFFQIAVEIDETDDTVKNITGKSLGESELSAIKLYEIEINTENDLAASDYESTILYNKESPSTSLLDRLLEKAPGWRIAHVDSWLANKQRTFEFDDESIYDAFQEIAEELDCIFIINSGSDENGNPDRYISVYDLQSYCPDCGYRGDFVGACPDCGSYAVNYGYGEDTSIFVSVDNLADEIVYENDVDSVVNCFKLETGDDLMTATVINCNPNGSSYIWYITDDVKADMSDELVAKLDSYDRLYEYYQNDYTFSFTQDGTSSPNATTLAAYNAVIEKYQVYNEELETVDSTITGYAELMKVYYDTIDLKLYLQSSFMPDASLSDTSAEEQADEVISVLTASDTVVAVADLDSDTSSITATSAVKLYIKAIIDSRYSITEITCESYDNDNYIWRGSFTITNDSDEDDNCSGVCTVQLSGSYEEYLRQTIEKALKDEDTENVSISGLFSLELDEFTERLKLYCLDSLTTFYDACQACLSILIEQGIADGETWANEDPNMYEDLYVPYYNKLCAIGDEISVREEEIAAIDGEGTYSMPGRIDYYGGNNYVQRYYQMTYYGMQIVIDEVRDSINEALDFDNYLGEELVKEFSYYRMEDKYSNENYKSDGLGNAELFDKAYEFLEKATEELYKSAQSQHSITGTLKNLLVMEEFEPILDNFEVGNWIRIKVDEDIYRLRLLSYELDLDDLDTLSSVTFSDITKVKTGISDVASVLNSAQSIAKSYSAVTRQASQGADANSTLLSLSESGIDASVYSIGSSGDLTILLNENGLLFRRYDDVKQAYDNEQLRIINNVLSITDDKWKSVKTAIGKFYYTDPSTGELLSAYGVNGDVLYGNLILGSQLGIYTEDKSLVFDENGLTINTNGGEGAAFTITNNDNVQMYIDSDGNIVLSNGATIYWGDMNIIDLVIDVSSIVCTDENGNQVGIFDYIETSYLTADYIMANCIDVNTLQAEFADILKLQTGELYAEIAEIAQLKADNIVTNYLTAEYISSNCIDTSYLNADEISSYLANIVSLQTSELYAEIAKIAQLKADDIVTNYLTAEYITANCIDTDALQATLADIISLNTGELYAAIAEIAQLKADNIVTNYLTAEYVSTYLVDTQYLNADEINAYIANLASLVTGELYAEIAEIAKVQADEIVADYVKTEVLESEYVKTSDLDASVASIVNLTTSQLYSAIADIGYLKAGELDAQVANLVQLNTSELYAAIADLGYLTADSITVTDITADIANITSLLAGNAGVGDLQAIYLSSANVVIADATITDAMIASLTADKLTAGTIYTDLVTIQSNEDDTSLWISGSVIQMSDGNYVRVQIGQDASGTYNFYIWDADGNLMWNALGVTADGLNDNIIVDKNVAEDAAIKGTKLDIESVSSCLNEAGLIEVDASKVVIDDTTLSAAFTTITGDLASLEENAMAVITTYYALGGSDTEPPSDPSTDNDVAAAIIGTAIVDESNVGNAYWTTERLTADGDGVYLWVVHYVEYADGSVKWTTPTCLTDGYLRDTTSTLQTEFTVISGQIESKVWLTDITEATNELGESITEIRDQYTQVLQDYDGITTTIADITTTLDSHSSKITTIEETAEGIQTTISELTSTVNGNSEKITTISETVDGISTSVSDLQTTVEGNTKDISTVTQTASELSTTVSSLSENLDSVSESVSKVTQTADTLSASVQQLQQDSLTTEIVYFAIGGSPDTPPSDPSTESDSVAATIDTAIVGSSNIDTVEWTTERLKVDGDGLYLWTSTLLTHADGSTEWTTPICITDEYAYSKITDMGSEIEMTAEAISSKVWMDDVQAITDNLGNSITVIREQYSEIVQTASDIELRVTTLEDLGEEHSTTISELLIDMDKITTRVSSTESDLNELNNSAQTGTYYEYYVSTSPTELNGGSWSTETPTWEEGYYIWRRTTVTTGVGEYAVTTTTDPICLTGNTGASGTDGKTTYLHIKYSETATPSSASDLLDEPSKYIGTYCDYVEEDSTNPSDYTWSQFMGDNGTEGVGIKTVTEYYAVSSSNTNIPSSWSTTVQSMSNTNKYLWNYEVVTYTDGSTESTEKRVIGVYGDTGNDGNDGQDGVGVSSVTNYYLATSASENVTVSTNGWTETIQNMTSENKYLWNYEVLTYTDNSKDTMTPCIIGVYGDTGNDGIGILSIVEYYALSTSSTSVTGTWSTDVPTMTSTNKYLWNYEVINYTDGTNSTGSQKVIGVYGATGNSGVGIASIVNYYLASSASSGITTDTSGWTETTQETSTSAKYLWNYEIVTYTDGTTYTSTPCVIGTHGETGENGTSSYLHIAYADSEDGSEGFSLTDSTDKAYFGQYVDENLYDSTDYKDYTWSKIKGEDGNGIVSTTAYYAVSESSTYYPTDGGNTTAIVGEAIVDTSILGNNGSWSTSQPEVGDYEYLWMKMLIEYSDGTSEYTEPCLLTDVSTKTAMYTLTEKYSDITQTIDTITLTVSDLQTSYYSGYEEILKNIAEIKMTEYSITSTVQSISDTVDGYEERITTVEETADGITTTIKSLSDTVNDNSEKITTISETVDGITTTISDIKDTIDGTSEKITTIEETVDGINTTISDIQSTVDSNSEKITEISETVDGITTSVSNIQDTVDGHTEDISKVTQTANGLTSTVSSLSDTVNGLSESVSTVTQTADTLTATVKSLQEDSITTETVYFAIGGSPDTPPSDPSVSTSGTVAAVIDVAIVGTSVIDTVEWTTERLKVDGDGLYLWTATLLTYADGSTKWTTPICITDDYVYSKITDMGSEIEMTAESITSKVWMDDVQAITDNLGNSITVLQQVYTEISQTADSIALRVTDLESFENTTNTTISEIILDVDSITNRVSSTETSLNTLNSSAQTGTYYEYYKSTSPTSLTGGSWSTTVPTWEEGYYIWRRTTITTGVGDSATTSTTDPVCLTGNTGVSGTDGSTTYLHIKYSEVENPTTSSELLDEPNKYIGTYCDHTETDSTDPSDYTWSQFIGDDGADGQDGQDGQDGKDGENGTSSYLHIAYANSEDGKTDFSTTDSTDKTYFGQYVDSNVDGSETYTDYTWSKIKGEDGNGIASTTAYYAVSESATYYPTDSGTTTALIDTAIVGTAILGNSGKWTTTQPEVGDYEYLWMKILVEYSDGTFEYTEPCLLTDATTKAAMYTLTEKYSEITQTLDDITLTVSDLKTNYYADYETITKEISSIKLTATSITSTVESLTETVDGNTEDISKVTQTANTLTSTVSSLKDSVDANTSDISTISQSISDISLSITSAVNSVATYYGTCSSMYGNPYKAVVCEEFTSDSYVKGAVIRVTFDYYNGAYPLYLNINDTGNVQVYADGAIWQKDNEHNWSDGATVVFKYDGTVWNLVETGSYEYTESFVEASLVLSIETDDDNNKYGALSANVNYIEFNSNTIVINSDQFALDGDGNATFGGTINAGIIQSVNYVGDNTADGSAIIGIGTIGNAVVGNNGKVGLYINLNDGTLDSAQFTIDEDGNATFSGELIAASGTFGGELSAATGTFSGELIAASGTFDTITGGILQSSNYVSGSKGIKIDLDNGSIDCTSISINNGDFTLDSNGNATFGGELISPKGTIGGFTIGETAIYNNKTSLNDETSGVYIGIDGIGLYGETGQLSVSDGILSMVSNTGVVCTNSEGTRVTDAIMEAYIGNGYGLLVCTQGYEDTSKDLVGRIEIDTLSISASSASTSGWFYVNNLNETVTIHGNLVINGELSIDGANISPTTQYGTSSNVTVSATSTTIVSVTFDTAFSSTPTVVACTQGGYAGIVATVSSVSTTGFTAYLYNTTSTARSIAMSWIATV